MLFDPMVHSNNQSFSKVLVIQDAGKLFNNIKVHCDLERQIEKC